MQVFSISVIYEISNYTIKYVYKSVEHVVKSNNSTKLRKHVWNY